MTMGSSVFVQNSENRSFLLRGKLLGKKWRVPLRSVKTQTTPPQSGTTTGAPTHSASAGVMPEFLRMKQAVVFSGVGKSTLAEAIRRGDVKSHLLRKKGNISGCRLISVASLREWIASH